MIYRYIKKLKVLKIKRSLLSVGSNFIFDPQSSFITPKEIEIGNNVFIGNEAYIAAKIKIGNNVMFGPRPVVIGGNHYFGVKGKSNRFLKAPNRENMEQIVVEDEVWCGASVIILGGVTIHTGAVIGAGSLVNKTLPPYTVCVGNPCKPYCLIFSDSLLEEHLSSLGYNRIFISETINARNEINGKFGLLKNNLKVVDNTTSFIQLYKNAGISL